MIPISTLGSGTDPILVVGGSRLVGQVPTRMTDGMTPHTRFRASLGHTFVESYLNVEDITTDFLILSYSSVFFLPATALIHLSFDRGQTAKRKEEGVVRHVGCRQCFGLLP